MCTLPHEIFGFETLITKTGTTDQSPILSVVLAGRTRILILDMWRHCAEDLLRDLREGGNESIDLCLVQDNPILCFDAPFLPPSVSVQ